MSIAYVVFIVDDLLPAEETILQPLITVFVQSMLPLPGVMDLYFLLDELIVPKFCGVGPEWEGHLHAPEEGVILVVLELGLKDLIRQLLAVVLLHVELFEVGQEVGIFYVADLQFLPLEGLVVQHLDVHAVEPNG